MPLVYEPQYRIFGWPDDSGKAIISWFDRDLADPVAQTPVFIDPDLFFSASLSLSVSVSFFINQNAIFIPRVALIALPLREVLKNEIRRTTFLTGPKRT